MPAAAVIPAPIAYIKVVAVKKLVVGFLAGMALARHGHVTVCRCAPVILLESGSGINCWGRDLDLLL